MSDLFSLIGIAVSFVLIAIVLIFIMAFPTMLLWNWLMPVIFELPTIDFWQALGLMTLSTLLFWRSGSKSK